MRRPLLLLALLLLVPVIPPASADGGWINDTFEEDVEITRDPASPTEVDSVQIFIAVKDPQIAISFAQLRYFVRFPGTTREDGPYSETFLPAANSNSRRFFAPALAPRPNGTVISYSVDAYDFFNVPRGSLLHNYTVLGEVVSRNWLRETFEENVNLTFAPAEPQPQEAVAVNITSVFPEVTISTAHLWVVYTYYDNPPSEGGFTFERTGNATLTARIPGYRAGTTVRFWVIAYDLSNQPMVSSIHNYSLSVERYTANPPDLYPQGEVIVGLLLASAVAVAFSVGFGLGQRSRGRKEG